jgi:hypothetical protein
VICTRQKATGTGVVTPGGVKLFAAIDVAVMEVTSGKTRLESLLQLSANADAEQTAVTAASGAVKLPIFGVVSLSTMFSSPWWCMLNTGQSNSILYASL